MIWEDGRCSQAKIQFKPGKTRNDWKEELNEWRLAVFEDPYVMEISPPEPLPLVTVEDREITKILKGDYYVLFDQLAWLLKERPVEVNLRATIQVTWGYRHVRTSAGQAVTYTESYYQLGFTLDQIVSSWFAKRRFIQQEELLKLWNKAIEYLQYLKLEAPPIAANTTVVFSAAVVEVMLGQFILPNFSGLSVLEGQSAFSRERFQDNELVFGQGVSLVVDPLRPLERGSYLITVEGVPAIRTDLVRNGRLQTPFLRAKEARRLAAQPTGIPQGTAGLYLTHCAEESWPEALSQVKDGVLILSVLGLHTQDSVSGEYSLSAPQSLRIREGKFIGKVDVKLNGNFFKDLASSQTRFARTPSESQPYLILQTGLQNF